MEAWHLCIICGEFTHNDDADIHRKSCNYGSAKMAHFHRHIPKEVVFPSQEETHFDREITEMSNGN